MEETQNTLRRSRKQRAFTQVDNEIINNAALSWQAKGLLAYLLSKKDGWKFYESDIEKRATNGKSSVRSIIKELVDSGYLIRGERFRDEKGHLKGYSYTVEPYLLDDYDGVSYIRFSKVGNSKVGKPYVGKSDDSNTNLLSNTNSFSNTKDHDDDEKAPANAFTFYQQNFGVLSNYVHQDIGAWIDDFNSHEIVIEAMKLALENQKPWSYAKAILKDWFNHNLKTIEQIQIYQQQKKGGRSDAAHNGRNSTGNKYQADLGF